jgi:RND family efflux transporter MFP subunit
LSIALCAVASCSAGAEKAPEPPPALQVGQENVVVVERDTIVSGPIISGELRAAEEASVRAEAGGSVLQVAAEEGQTVRMGALLARIEAVALEDARRSAASAVRSAENQLDLARREVERNQQLVAAGAIAPRDLDQARNAVSQAEAQVADARARLVSAEKEIGHTVIRSPIAGVVSERAVNTGDVVAAGAAMFTIIDPRSMRLEASVPSDQLAALRVGLPVRFMVRGYPEPFTGAIERISPAADPTTRQVPIFVAIPNTEGRLVSGLFAEGRVINQQANGLVIPTDAVNITGNSAWVLRVTGGKTERVDVQVGLVDPQTERVQIASGVNERDVLLRGSARAMTPGTPVKVNLPSGD